MMRVAEKIPGIRTLTSPKSSYQLEIKLILIVGILWLLVQLVTLGKNVWIYHLYQEKINYSSMIGTRLISGVVGFLFMSLVIFSTQAMLKRKFPWFAVVFTHLLCFVLVTTGTFQFIYLANTIVIPEQAVSGFLKFYLVEVDRFFLMYLLVSVTTYAFNYFREGERKSKTIKRLNQDFRQIKMKNLNHELSPHILYNSLNSISTCVKQDAGKAIDLIADLGDFLRENVYKKSDDLIKINDEIRLIQKYVKIRSCNDILPITCNIFNETGNPDILIPHGILQPLVENAIKHSPSIDGEPIQIDIDIQERSEHIFIAVKNIGSLPDETSIRKRNGKGLDNVINRLALMYGNTFHFTLSSEGEYVSANLVLPQTEKSNLYTNAG